MGRKFDDYSGFQPFRSWANTYAQDCTTTKELQRAYCPNIYTVNQVQKPNSSSKTKTKVTPQKPRNFGSSAGKKILVEEWSIFLLKSGQN